MKSTEFWYWRMRSETTKKVGKSPCRYTEEVALKLDPNAVRIPGSMEIRECPETQEELAAAAPTNRHLGAFNAS